MHQYQRVAKQAVARVVSALAVSALFASVWLVSMPSLARADDAASRAEISAALNQWTADFNAGRADKTCELFSRELRADYRGLPERGYDGQCKILKQSLSDPTRRYSYALAIKEILVWGDVAVVRLTWTLTVRPEDGKAITAKEQGLDVFRKESDGRWRIVRYMAYEE
jgi:ketosteroid isomerase-like protein